MKNMMKTLLMMGMEVFLLVEVYSAPLSIKREIEDKMLLDLMWVEVALEMAILGSTDIADEKKLMIRVKVYLDNLYSSVILNYTSFVLI